MSAEKATTTTSAANGADENNKKPAARNIPDLKFSDFWDSSKPWVLVPDGSIGGFFDFVPRHLRVGPWSGTAIVYWTSILYVTALGIAFFSSKASSPYWWPENLSDEVVYPPPFSRECWYHTILAVWMLYIIYLILTGGPAGRKVFATFTVQSWTMLTLRHGLSALACWYSTSTNSPLRRAFLLAAEIVRFPSACSTTITFFVWNFAVFPFVYLYGMKTAEQRKGFVKFATSFRLVQIHVFNIIFCWLNQVWASPPRKLVLIDFFLAFLSTIMYMTFYLLILDRLGIHLYPVFSPRAGSFTVVLTWSSLLALYVATFIAWKHFLTP